MSEVTAYETLKASLQAQISEKKLPPLIQREFRELGVEKKGQEIRVMQWNMLAQALSGVEANFILCPPEALEWENRQIRILEEIVRYRPTVLCLQEVDQFDFLTERLAQIGYLGVFFPKPLSPCLQYEDNTGPDGCALMYDTAKLTLQESETFVLKMEDGKNSNQVAIVGKFQMKTGKQEEFCIAVTHLKSKPSFSDHRRQQASYLMKRISPCYDDVPVIVCGDFNGPPSEPFYSVVELCDLGFSSAYTSLSPQKAEPKFTTWKTRPAGTVCHVEDYVWYTSKGLTLASLLDIPSDEEVGKDALPCLKYPSDHISLVCDFVFQ